MANALFKVGDDIEAVVPARGSLCVAVQGAAPRALVSGAFHHLPARGLANLDQSLDADVLVCSDHAAATKATIELVDRIPGCRGIDAGTLVGGGGDRGVHGRAHRRQHPLALACQHPADGPAHRKPLGLVNSSDALSVMRLYDTARREVVPFTPGEVVTMYTCGITPYDSAHLGHAAVYLIYDVLQRRLRDLGHRTLCVRNITDVDDDILRKARELGVHYLDLAAGEIARFDADMAALGLLRAYSEPRATSAIPDILGFIGMVLDTGHAYRAGGAVYFDVSSFPRFGQVSHLERDEMVALAALRGGRPEDPFKDDPLDFVLWQPSAPGEPSWESLWGPGRPGWHIECSALAIRELGTTIDLHGGGTDLIFPHHECESAQSEAATGSVFVRHWMHVGDGGLWAERRCRSRSAISSSSMTCSNRATTRPRSAWRCSPRATGLHGSGPARCWRTRRTASSDWRVAGRGGAGLEAVRARLDDDLDTPGAIAAIDAEAGAGRGVG